MNMFGPDDDPRIDPDGELWVRPYTVTNGRTRPSTALDLVSLVRATGRGMVAPERLGLEHAQALQLCHSPTSVAEIAHQLEDTMTESDEMNPAMVEQLVLRQGLDVDVTFCPERILEGRAMIELYELPQIVAARTDRARDRATALFGRLTDDVVYLEPEEAELAKLFTNTWRYIKFATANQLYMMANEQGLDFDRIRRGLAEDYPRAADMPAAGFAAGPCLFKDTMQLAAFNHNNFPLGHAAMAVNEGLPLYLVHRLEQRFDLGSMTVGILGMAFKGGSDDIRSSLSYKLKRILAFKADEVLCTDPYVTVDPGLLPLEEVLQRSDLLVVGAPHPEYRGLAVDKPAADIWDVLGSGVRV